MFLGKLTFYGLFYFEFSASTKFLFSVLHFLAIIFYYIVPNPAPSHLHLKQAVYKALVFFEKLLLKVIRRIILLHYKQTNLKYITQKKNKSSTLHIPILESSIRHLPLIYLWTSCFLLIVPFFPFPSHFSFNTIPLPYCPYTVQFYVYTQLMQNNLTLHILYFPIMPNSLLSFQTLQCPLPCERTTSKLHLVFEGLPLFGDSWNLKQLLSFFINKHNLT